MRSHTHQQGIYSCLPEASPAFGVYTAYFIPLYDFRSLSRHQLLQTLP